ncbi:MAG: lipase family protein [Xenococcus sp. MO_188.B8]|nr:lipase family protein [Xenococcus sp. MO_188.B8]
MASESNKKEGNLLYEKSVVDQEELDSGERTQFNPQVKHFNSQNMAYLARCARAVYGRFEAEGKDRSKADSTDSPEIKEELSNTLGYNFENTTKYDPKKPSAELFTFMSRQTETQGCVVGDEEKIIVVFRGTQQKLDWLANAKLHQETWTATRKIGKVHVGFYEAFVSVCSKMEDYIKQLWTKDQPIWVTGHSLGGALATLACAHIELQMPDEYRVAGAYTFGQPRVGNDDFADAFDERLKGRFFRIMNQNDVVCVLPSKVFVQPSKLIVPKPIRYKHVGTPIYFNDKGELVYDANWFERVGGRVKGIVGDFVKDFGQDILNLEMQEIAKLEISTIRDHFIAECYLPLAKEHLKKLTEDKLEAENKVD